ncbi:MAG: amidophosphoribosyltransferase [Bacillota bacterium]|nr:amidophosphoribosyltransferase [Bacillota bacterium]
MIQHEFFDQNCFDKINEECGLFGIFKSDEDQSISVVTETYAALFGLQHRGQESAGITVNKNGEFKSVKDLGSVIEVLTPKTLSTLPEGKIAVGHVRYSPRGTVDRAGTQPLVMRYSKGLLAIAHNGAITNLMEIRSDLELGGAIFQSFSNAELIAYVIATERLKYATIEEAVSKTMDRLKGAYSIVLSTPNMLIGMRDPNGFRPLCIGKLGNSYMLSSESCVFESLGAEFIRDVEPGEIVFIDDNGLNSIRDHCGKKTSLCLFEYIYIARPDSVIDGMSVHMARRNAGRMLAEEYPVEADLVCGVPDSGIDAAQGYAEASGIPYGVALIKNKYVGRTFNRQNAENKDRLLKIKLNALAANVKDKRIIIIDDSIVRGSTCYHIVKMLREAGAKEVHMRISSPPFLHPCYFGTDIRSKDELIATKMTVEEIKNYIGADSLGYLSLENARKIASGVNIGFCDGCFSGVYPAPIPENEIDDRFSRKIMR